MHKHILDVAGQRLVALDLNPNNKLPPLILLHGVSHSINVWLSQPIFQQHGRCYALSLPGHTPARLPPGFQASDLSAELITHVLAAAIDQLIGAQPYTVVGHSTGGFAALALAARYPQRVRRLISIAGFAHGRWTGPLAGWQKFARGSARQRRLLWLWFSSTRLMTRGVFRQHPIWRQSVADPQTLNDNPAFEQMVRAMYPFSHKLNIAALIAYCQRMPDINISAWLDQITAPSLIIAGDADPLVPPEQSTLIASHIPHAELAVLPNVGHLPMIEDQARYTQTIDSWLSQHPT